MREHRYKDFLLRDYQVPVVVNRVWYGMGDEGGEEYPHIATETRREVIYQGMLWPSVDEVHAAFAEYQLKFGRAPERLVLPRMNGAKIFGVEVVA